MANSETKHFEIFVTAPPGLEGVLCAEVARQGFAAPKAVLGGVVFMGGWPEVWRANLCLRGAGRVLARLDSFRAPHLAQLDKRARQVPWAHILRAGVPFRVEASCSKSRIYHSGAAAERIKKAITATLGAPTSEEEGVLVMARLEHDLCTLSVDTSGALLHKRGYKEAVNQAPMRETMAALFLMQCGYTGSEPLLDPMCGSGTFVIEAAEMAAGLQPGRERSFAFEQLPSFDAKAWQQMRIARNAPRKPACYFYGRDRDAGAIKMSIANAARAGVADYTQFSTQPISALTPPPGPAGLVMVNPPYGARIGDKKKLVALYRALGHTLQSGFKGWRVGIITTEAWLAEATGLPFLPKGAPVQHGGLRVYLYQTEKLL